MKFTEKYVRYTEKPVLVKKTKKVYKWAKHGFATPSFCWKGSWLSGLGKKKVPSIMVSKEGYTDSFLGHEMTNLYWFP